MTTTSVPTGVDTTAATAPPPRASARSSSSSFVPPIPMRASLRRRGDSEHRSIHGGETGSESDGLERVVLEHDGTSSSSALHELPPRRRSTSASHPAVNESNGPTEPSAHDRPPSSSLRTSQQSINGGGCKPPQNWCSANDDDCLRVYAIIPRIFSVIAFALSLTVLLDCRLIRLQRTFVATPNATSSSASDGSAVAAFGAEATLYFGLYQYASPLQLTLANGTTFQVVDLYHQTPSWESLTGNFTQNFTVAPIDSSCVRYPTDGTYTLTSDQAAARAFAILACVLGGMMMCLLWFKCCCGFLCSYVCPDLLVSLILLVLLPAVQGLAMVFDDQVCHFQALGLEDAIQNAGWIVQVDHRECGVDRRGLYYPFSIVLWITCGVLFTCIKPRREDDLPYFQR